MHVKTDEADTSALTLETVALVIVHLLSATVFKVKNEVSFSQSAQKNGNLSICISIWKNVCFFPPVILKSPEFNISTKPIVVLKSLSIFSCLTWQ